MGKNKKDNGKFEAQQKKNQLKVEMNEMDFLLNQNQGLLQTLSRKQMEDRQRQNTKAGHLYNKHIEANDNVDFFESDKEADASSDSSEKNSDGPEKDANL